MTYDTNSIIAIIITFDESVNNIHEKKEILKPKISLVLTKDNKLLWSHDEYLGGDPYLLINVGAKNVVDMLNRMADRKMFIGKYLYTPIYILKDDPSRVFMSVRYREKYLSMESLFELFENPRVSDGTYVMGPDKAYKLNGRPASDVLQNFPTDYLKYRADWQFVKNNLTGLIPDMINRDMQVRVNASWGKGDYDVSLNIKQLDFSRFTTETLVALIRPMEYRAQTKKGYKQFKNIILALDKDGTMIYSKDFVRGGAPYYLTKVSSSQIGQVLEKLETLDVFTASSITNTRPLLIDAPENIIYVTDGQHRMEMRSHHDVLEANNKNIVVTSKGLKILKNENKDEIIMNDDSDYFEYRALWSELKNSFTSLIPQQGGIEVELQFDRDSIVKEALK